MATYSANFPELLETRQKEIFFKNMTMQEQKFRQLLSVKKSTKSHEDRIRVAGLPTFAIKPEGTPVKFGDPVQGTRRRITHTAYALGYRVTREAVDDDQWNVIDRMSSDLGDSGRDHQERLAWDLINDGWDGARHTGLDGLSLFHTDHTRLRPEFISAGTTDSNTLSPAVQLSQAGLESIMTLSMSTQSDEGRYVVIDHDILCIHPTEMHNAYVLLETTLKPGSANNDVNTVVSSRSGLRPLITPYKTGTRSWSVHASPGKNSLQWNDRVRMEFSQAADADTQDMKHYAYYRSSTMFSEWRNNYGSNFS